MKDEYRVSFCGGGEGGWFFFATASVLSEESFFYKIVQKVTEKISGLKYYPWRAKFYF
jgi:hypothetical protein